MNVLGKVERGNSIFNDAVTGQLNSLFERKRSGLRWGQSEKELELLKRIKNLQLLRALVDRSCEMVMPDNYVPHPMEVELCVVAVTGVMRKLSYEDSLYLIMYEMKKWSDNVELA